MSNTVGINFEFACFVLVTMPETNTIATHYIYFKFSSFTFWYREVININATTNKLEKIQKVSTKSGFQKESQNYRKQWNVLSFVIGQRN